MSVERRHEQDAAADAEQAGQDTGGETDDDRDHEMGGRDGEQRAHQTNNRIPTPSRSAENASVSVRLASRC